MERHSGTAEAGLQHCPPWLDSPGNGEDHGSMAEMDEIMALWAKGEVGRLRQLEHLGGYRGGASGADAREPRHCIDHMLVFLHRQYIVDHCIIGPLHHGSVLQCFVYQCIGVSVYQYIVDDGINVSVLQCIVDHGSPCSSVVNASWGPALGSYIAL